MIDVLLPVSNMIIFRVRDRREIVAHHRRLAKALRRGDSARPDCRWANAGIADVRPFWPVGHSATSGKSDTARRGGISHLRRRSDPLLSEAGPTIEVPTGF